LFDDNSATNLLIRVSESGSPFSLLFALQDRHTSGPSNIGQILAGAAFQIKKVDRTMYNKNEKTPGVAAGGFNTGVVG
jgi:hypothetical protein